MNIQSIHGCACQVWVYESVIAGQAILSSPAMDSEGVLYYGTSPPLTKDGKPGPGKGRGWPLTIN